MIKSILKLAGAAVLGLSINAQAAELRPDHPDTYNVKKGDTLWDISSAFLRDPWLWPELWQVNPQIDNPHLIYPGDTIKLVYIDGKPAFEIQRGNRTIKYNAGDTVKLTPQARITPLDTVIPAIPLEYIQPFLVDNRVLTLEELEAAPYILAGDEQHILMGAGDYAYARGDFSEPHRAYGIYRKGVIYIDPETEEILGTGAEEIGIARFENAEGEIGRLKLTTTNSDARINDRLLPTEERKVNSTFYPKAPEVEVDGQIIHVFSGVRNVSQWNVVVLNRGDRDGIEVGDVLAVFSKGETVKDRNTNERLKLPDQRRGILMVFRTFDKVSYGLILRSSAPLKVLDRVGNP